MIPVVETERLILRPMVREDFPAYAAIWREPEVVRFTGGAVRSESDCWGRFLKIAGSWVMEGFGQWAVTRKSDGAFIGQTGFFNALRGIGADFDAAPEAGWVIATAFHGQGYGGEAVTAAHRWFDAQPFGGLSHAMISDDHAVSQRLAENLGYRFWRRAELERDDWVKLLVRDVRP